jgi:hypothetical protein
MYYKSVKLLILRTNIKSKKKLKKVAPLLNDHPLIFNWTLDLEDIDNVLRIEASSELQINNINELIQETGFYCEDLPGTLCFSV